MIEQPVERRVVSVLFADLVGFTSLSEGLDAEEVAIVQDQYFAQVRETIARYGGRLEKFIGDAAMAVFGVPRTRDDDAERAVRAGLALTGTVESLAVRLGLAEGALRLRVGVNTGEVAYSPSADGEWRVSGDAVNSAARLQTAADPGSVLVGDTTALAVAETIVVDRPVELELKGKSQAVRAWRAVTPLPHRSRERAMGSLRAPLLGREDEMATIAAATARVRAGATETLLVIAPPGVGKSRLLEEAVGGSGEDTVDQSVLVRRAHLGAETISPAAAVAQLLVEDPEQGSPELAADLGSRLAAALPADRSAELTPELNRLLAGGRREEPSIDGQAVAADLAQERELRFGAWVEILDVLGGDRPQLWLIEDLHWSGADLLAFVEHAQRQRSPHGRLVLGTARPIFLDQLGARAETGSGIEILELAPLAGADAGALVRALVGDALPTRLVESVVDRSDGNPLFIEELIRSWVSLGTLVADDDGHWRLAAAPEDVALPQTVQQIYSAQLDDLPHPARTLVRRASVAGRDVPRRSLDALDLPDADDAVSVARRRALLGDGPPNAVSGPALSYRHALLRDAGYSSLARAERARLHARLAGWYERVAGDRAAEVAEQIAGHYAAAVEHASRLSPRIDDALDLARARQLAIEWYERAATRALDDAAHETARALLRQALHHADESPALVRARLLLALGQATAYTADMDEGAGLLSDSLEAARRAHAAAADGEREECRLVHAAAAAALCRVWIQQVRFDDAQRLAEETLEAIGGPEDAAMARLLAPRAWVESTLHPDPSSLADLDRALAIARSGTDRRLELEILDWRAMALGEVDLVEIEDWAAVGRLAVDLGDWSRAVKAMRVQAAWNVDDEHGRIGPLLDKTEEIARRRGLEEDVCWIDYIRAEARFADGDWQAALAAGRRALELGTRNSYDRAVVRTLHVLLPIATARGEPELIERAHAWHEARRHFFPDSPFARIVGAAMDLHVARIGLMPPFVPEVGPRLVAFEGEPGGPSWLAALEEVVESWLGAGEIDGVRDALGRMDRSIAEKPGTSHLARGTAAYLRSRLLTVDGVREDALQAAREALGEFRQSGAPWWTAKGLRVLTTHGAAGPAEAEELARIEKSLGLALS